MDIPRIFNITESAHRIHNPFTPDKYATLGAALRLSAGARVLDLGSGSGEMLCTWARDHGIVGTGIDMSPLFTAQALSRAVELGVTGGTIALLAQSLRRRLQANPNDELAHEVRALLTTEPLRHVTYTREYLGWGVFALMAR